MRSLERKIGAICRAVAVKVAEGHKVSRAESPTEPHAGKSGIFFISHIIVVYGWNYISSPRLCFSRRLRIDGSSLWAKIKLCVPVCSRLCCFPMPISANSEVSLDENTAPQ